MGTLRVSGSPESGIESAVELSSGINDQPTPSVCLEDVKSSLAVSPLTFFFRLTDECSFPGWRIQPKPEAKPDTAVTNPILSSDLE